MAPSAAPDMAFLRDPRATPTAAMAWWVWWDQGLYQKAAVAWANGVTDPAFHWYLPGYPLLGAAFVRVTPADPFLLPNLAALLGTLWLFCGVASRLLHDVPLRIPAACGLFVATSVLPPRVLWSWVVPWTTTPETFCIFGALLGAMRLVEGGRRRDAVLTGLAAAAIAGFRPADAGVVGLAICAVAGPALLSSRRRLPGILAAAAGGASIPLLVFGGAYLATWGTRPSSYLLLSSQIGFEPRLFALRWVALMLDPHPLHPGGRGLAGVFFWVLPGFAGMAATLLTARHAAFAHGLVIVALAGDVALFLTYRDLHPTGLWEHGNYHYFKWTLPLFALYALRLLPAAINRDRYRPVAIAAACLTIPALSCWQAGTSPIGPLQADQEGSITVASGLRPVSAMVLVPGHGPGGPPVVDGSAETASGTVLRYGLDFVIYGTDETLRIVPLRPLPPEPTIFRFSKDTYVNQELAPLLARQTVTWGLPFWLARDPQAQGAASR